MTMQGQGRGVVVHGTSGSLFIDQNGYTVYDAGNAVVRQSSTAVASDGLNTSGDDEHTTLHLANFIAAIRSDAPLHAPIDEGHRTQLLCHLGNIAQWTGRTLRTDPLTGRILDDRDAMRHWSRDYAPGWAPTA